MKLYKVN